MAIQEKLKITRDQLAEFIESHNTIRQFERLFEYINTFVIPDPEVNTSNCFIEESIQDWGLCTPWTSGNTIDIPHTLNSLFSGISYTMQVRDPSSPGKEYNANFSSYIGSGINFLGQIIQGKDNDMYNVELQIGATGPRYASSSGTVIAIPTTWEYKVVLAKFTVLT